MTEKFPFLGPTGLALLTEAVKAGVVICDRPAAQASALRVHQKGLLARDAARADVFYPTMTGQRMIEATGSGEGAAMEIAPEVLPAPDAHDAPENGYPAHPLANLFPMMDDGDIAKMADDIVTYGQRQPIVLLDGLVLDGRNRQSACRIAGVVPRYERFAGDDPLGFVLSLNEVRRHLTTSQRAMVAAKIVDWDYGLNQFTGSANLQTHEAARLVGKVSERAVAAAKRIRDHGTAELMAAIEDGRIKVHVGEALSWLEASEQARVLAEEERAIAAAAKDIRRRRQEANHAARLARMAATEAAGKELAGPIAKKFGVIYADPPWRFGVHSEVTGREKSAENHYPTMATDDILDLFEKIGSPAARDAVCFLWATNPMLQDGLAVLEAWGFSYVHHWVWDKQVAGTGYWGRDCHELLLIGRRGQPATPLPGSQPSTVYSERKGAHSQKPDFFAETIERLYPGVPRLEMFCRSPRPGWDSWGFEASPPQAEEIAASDLSREGLSATPREGAGGAHDDLYVEAVAIVREAGKGSIAMIQRRLAIGYNRAARMIEAMEADGIVGPADHAGKRVVWRVASREGATGQSPADNLHPPLSAAASGLSHGSQPVLRTPPQGGRTEGIAAAQPAD